MELLTSVCGPVATNVYVLGDPSSREAIAIDMRRRASRGSLACWRSETGG